MPVFCLFLGPIWCALSIFESGISTPASFTNFLTFSRTFSDVSSLSNGMLVIHRQVLRLHCSLQSTKYSRLLHFPWSVTFLYIFLSTLLSLGVFTCSWSKLTVEESFSISCGSSFIICLISSLKTTRKLDFICSIKFSLNYSTFSSTAVLNSSVLGVLDISK